MGPPIPASTLLSRYRPRRRVGPMTTTNKIVLITGANKGIGLGTAAPWRGPGTRFCSGPAIRSAGPLPPPGCPSRGWTPGSSGWT